MDLQIHVLCMHVMPSLHWYSAEIHDDSRLFMTVQFCWGERWNALELICFDSN